MTTNGLLFEQIADRLKEAGLDAVNFSLDTLKAEKYNKICGIGLYGRTRQTSGQKAGQSGPETVLMGIEKALSLGLKTKINCLPIRGFNEDEIAKLAGLAKKYPLDVRFIELMPLGCGTKFMPISQEEVRNILGQHYEERGYSTLHHGNGPASYIDYEGFLGSIGFISALSHQFCGQCNRIRLSADGFLKLCLHQNKGLSLKPYLRENKDTDLKSLLRMMIYEKPEHHKFGKAADDTVDERKMFQIGG